MAASIQINGLTKSFPADGERLEVLGGISINVNPGEFVSILGPSGCGKSTIFALLAGIERPDGGEIVISGQPAGPDRPFAWMPQRDVLLPWRSVRDNVALGAEVAAGKAKAEARATSDALLAEFDLADFADSRPFQLSGGMRQRAALARTVAQGRGVLLLDEPFGALDSLTRTELQLWLEQIRAREQWTVVLITHDVREAVLLSDRVYVLSERPATVVTEMEIDLSRPRNVDTLGNPRAAELETQLLHALHVGEPKS
jgi:ABC-type nitrate/sulfonate/bicarbonate transport system ATPase subunit